MIDNIKNDSQFQQVIVLIEGFIKKATDAGGFNSLSKTEADELSRLSLLAEQYEDNILKIIPLLA